MTTLELTSAELDLLTTILRSRLASLTTEIDHTDLRAFRDALKSQRRTLEGLVARLPAAAAASAA